MSQCPHVNRARAPNQHDNVHKEECTRCFQTDEMPGGVNVCLTCFNGACSGLRHDAQHAKTAGHPLVVNIKKHKIERDPSEEQPAKVSKVDIASVLKSTTPQYKFETHVHCLDCNMDIDGNKQLEDIVEHVLKAEQKAENPISGWTEEPVTECPHSKELSQAPNAPMLASKAFSKCSDCDINEHLWLCMTCGNLGCSRPVYGGLGGNGHGVKHNETTGHPLVCKMGTISAAGTADIYCYKCERMVEDKQLKAHMAHFGLDISASEKTVLSQSELELVSSMGMDFSKVYTKEGKEEELAFGAGNTGLDNLGNSCYMASVVQSLFHLPSFKQRYFDNGVKHLADCKAARPADCFSCQMAKLAEAIWSGRYSAAPAKDVLEAKLDKEDEEARRLRLKNLQPGVKPRMFKALIARDHVDFKGTKQQDALEFLQFFLQQVQQKERASGEDPTKIFEFTLENRIECTQCHRVRYQVNKATELSLPIPQPKKTQEEELRELKEKETKRQQREVEREQEKDLDEKERKKREDARVKKEEVEKHEADLKQIVEFEKCLQAWSAPSDLDSYNCSQCGRKTKAVQTSRFHSFPDTLLVAMRRFEVTGWVPRKLGTRIVGVDRKLDLAGWQAKGLQPGEVEFPADKPQGQPRPNEAVVNVLKDMGFTQNQAERAALAVNGGDAEAAMGWLLAHLEDANINDPVDYGGNQAKPGAAGPEANSAAVNELVGMGFTEKQVRYALKETNNDANRALDWLFSHSADPLPDEAPVKQEQKVVEDPRPPHYKLFAFINHLGASASTGHYVAHIVGDDGRTIFFNDSKVSVSSEPPHDQAYIYVLRKVDK